MTEMPSSSRIHHLGAVGLVVTASLFLVLVVRAGWTAAATGTSVQGNVGIHLQGSLSGPQFAAFGRGRFTMSGAISDHRRFVDEFQGVHPADEPHVRTLRGARGTIRIKVDGAFGSPKWRITSGTKAYAGLRGRGTQEGQYKFVGIYATMTGTIRK